MASLPTDPISGQSGPYSPAYIQAAQNVSNGNTAPYKPGYLGSLGLPEYTSRSAPSGPSPEQVYQQQQAAAAAAAEAQRIAGIRNAAQVGQEGAVQSANSGLGGYRDSYRLQNQNIVNNWRSGVEGYNQGRSNTALNLRRGIAGVTSGVRQGLQGAMTALPDSALDSGATGALARSWNKQGQQQAGGVYNEASLANQGLDRAFAEAQRIRDEAQGNLGIDRNTKVADISNALYNQLRTIDANASAQGVNGAVNMGLRDSVINNAIAQLNALDQERGSQLGGINALGAEDITRNAIAMDVAGAQAYNPFTLPTAEGLPVDEESPVSQLPFYVRRRDF